MPKIRKQVTAILEKMSREGCAVGVTDGSFNMTFDVAVAWTRTEKVYWCQAMPEHQSHVHCMIVTVAEVVHGRDIWFTGQNGRKLYFAPTCEWFDIDRVASRRNRDQWEVAVTDPEQRQRIAEFLTDCIGDAPDWMKEGNEP